MDDEKPSGLQWARRKYQTCRVATALMALPFIALTGTGMAKSYSLLGTPLYKLPLLRFLRLLGLGRIELAHVLALAVLLAVLVMTEHALACWWAPEDDAGSAKRKPFVTTVAVVALLCDSGFFYLGLVEALLFRSAFSFPALLLSLAYAASLMFVAYLNVTLKEEVKRQENDEEGTLWRENLKEKLMNHPNAKWVALGVLAVFALIALGQLGGEDKPESYEPPIQTPKQPVDNVLILTVDLSDSCKQHVAGKGYEFGTDVMGRFCGSSGNSRIVVAQLSGGITRALIFDGSPAALKDEFPDANAFRRFILSRADDRGSRLFDGIAESVDYALAIPNSQNARYFLCVLSDMEDNVSPDTTRLERSLAELARRKSSVGIYWAGNEQIATQWNQKLSAIFPKGRYEVHAGFRVDVPLPKFQ